MLFLFFSLYIISIIIVGKDANALVKYIVHSAKRGRIDRMDITTIDTTNLDENGDGVINVQYKRVHLITRNNRFDANVIFSTAFLKLLLMAYTGPDYKGDIQETDIVVHRVSFNELISLLPELVESGEIYIVYGVGEFDHRTDCPKRSNGIPYASFGFLWKRYAKNLFTEDFISWFDEKFVQEIDRNAVDNSYHNNVTYMIDCLNNLNNLNTRNTKINPQFRKSEDMFFDDVVNAAKISLMDIWKVLTDYNPPSFR